MENQIIEVGGSNWLVRRAVSMDAALDAIAMARVTGSVGSRHEIDDTACGGSARVTADVVRLNAYGTECKPYSA